MKLTVTQETLQLADDAYPELGPVAVAARVATGRDDLVVVALTPSFYATDGEDDFYLFVPDEDGETARAYRLPEEAAQIEHNFGWGLDDPEVPIDPVEFDLPLEEC